MDTLPAREGEALEKARRRGDMDRDPSTIQNIRERVVHESDWAQYKPAIEQWKSVTGREAPEPVELNDKSKPQLSACFVEWMMGLPDGWVTDVVNRKDAIKMLGNGVVPQQAFEALTVLFEEDV